MPMEVQTSGQMYERQKDKSNRDRQRGRRRGTVNKLTIFLRVDSRGERVSERKGGKREICGQTEG